MQELKNKVFYAAMHASLGTDGATDRFLTANSTGAKYFVIDTDPPVNTSSIPSGTWTNSSSFTFTADSGGIYSAPVSETIIFNSNATVRLVQGIAGSGKATFL